MYIICMGLREDIFGYLDDGKTTLVFPTENAARHWLSMYARQRRTSVLADRAIALDSFKELFAPVHSQKPSNKYHRLAFAASLLSSKTSGLRYLYNDSYYSYRRRFIPLIVRIIPSLMELDDVSVLNSALRMDLQTIRSRYGQFLQQHGLFEPGWEKHDIRFYKGPKLNHVLVGYDCDIQMQRLMDELGEVEGVGFLVLEETESACYHQYSTEEAELDEVFHRLHELKIENVATSDIIISTPSFDSLLPRLERKALEFGVPLSFMGSVDISKTVPGRYLNAVLQCLSEQLSFASMENLLLNSSFPYKDMDVNQTLIRFMIDKNVGNGSLDMTNDPLYLVLRRFGDQRAFDLYVRLKSSLNALRRSRDIRSLSESLHALTTLLFGGDEFNNGPQEDKDVYSFILSELSVLGKVLSDTSLAMDDMFTTFMDAIGGLSYVRQESRDGIRVYRYGQDPLLYVQWHFVIGLNDSNSILVQSELDFLQDHEAPSRKKYDVTQRMLEYYGSSGENVIISGSEESFEGSESTPIPFLLKGTVRSSCADSEEILEKADSIGMDMAENTSMAEKGDDLARGDLGFSSDPDSKTLSYSRISSYAKCHYMAFVEETILKGVPEHFEPATQDDKEIGSFLHRVIQQFMKIHMGSFVVPERIVEYHEELERIMDEMLLSDMVFDPYTKKSIRGRYLQSLKSALDIMLLPPPSGKKRGYIGAFKPICNEYKLDHNPSFIGYVDTIIVDKEGRVHLLDYKKGEANATYQLVLYSRLYAQNPQFGPDVGQCLFYSMGSSSFNGFNDEKWEEQSLRLDEDIQKLKDGYRKGMWNATPSKESCLKCRERSVCRRRFNLQ